MSPRATVRLRRRAIPTWRACALALLSACAPTGVTLRSNHYRVYVPPRWQVLEAGGGALPTLVRTPPAGDTPGIDVRIYAWVVEGPLADPAGDAFQRLHAAGVLARIDPEPAGSCSGEATSFVVFGQPARAIHAESTSAGRAVVTASHAFGSLVALVAAAGAGNAGPRCAQVIALDSAVGEMAASLILTGDPTRPILPPAVIDLPQRPTTEIPQPDPSAPPP